MKKNIAVAWAKRLKVNPQRQGYGQLGYLVHDEEKRCCLGELCEMAVEAGIITKSVGEGGTVRYGDHTVVLPLAVRAWSGMSSGHGYISAELSSLPALSSLSGYNDTQEGSWPMIADLILKHWKEL